MADASKDNPRGSVIRYLETDALLGVRSVPLVRPQSAAPSRPSAAPRPTARPPVKPEAARVRPQRAPADPAAAAVKSRVLGALDAGHVKGCTKCALSQTRTNTVFGQGDPNARLVFVGEAPGADEDAQGLAFVGKAGQLLTKMINAMGLTREQVFICNLLKCRPPNNRDPAPDEVSACRPYLDEQLRTIGPEVIVTLGKPAAQTLLRTTEGIGRLRGQWHDYYTSGSPLEGAATPLMPTYHPAYLLRSPGEKGKAWSDLKQVMARLGLPVPPHV